MSRNELCLHSWLHLSFIYVTFIFDMHIVTLSLSLILSSFALIYLKLYCNISYMTAWLAEYFFYQEVEEECCMP